MAKSRQFNVIAKMGKSGDVSMQVLLKIYETLDYWIEDIVRVPFIVQ